MWASQRSEIAQEKRISEIDWQCAKEFAIFVKSIFENIMLNGETIRLDGAIRMGPK